LQSIFGHPTSSLLQPGDTRSSAAMSAREANGIECCEVDEKGVTESGSLPAFASSWVAELEVHEHPRHWSLARKVYHNAIFLFLTLITTYTSGVYSPGVQALMQDVLTSTTVAHLGTSLYMFGLAIGSLLWGPLSQVLGRRPVFLASLLSMVLLNLGASLANNMAGIVTCRALAGVTGAAIFSNVAGSIVDMTSERERIPYNSLFRLMTFLGPPAAALLGAVAVEDASWRWNLRSIPIVCATGFLLYATTCQETYVPVLQEKKAARLRKSLRAAQQPHPTLLQRFAHAMWCLLEDMELIGPLALRIVRSLFIPWVLLFEEPLVIVVCFYTSMLYGLLYGALQFFPDVWHDIRGLTPVQVGYTYLAVIAGFVLSTAIVGCGIQEVQYRRAYDQNEHTPELRIRSGMFSLFFVPVGLFIFAWTAPFPHVHWTGPCIGILCFSFGMLSVFNSWMAYLTDTYSNNTAAVIAINTFCRSALAGAFPLFTQPMIHTMTFQGAMSMFGGVSIPLTCIGMYFAIYGKHLRHKSKHAVYG